MLAEPVYIGADLRAERLRQDLSLADVAEELCVRESYLDAIERGERANTPGVLPGVGYVLGYVRAYAEFVGMSGDVAVDRYKAEMAIPENLRLRDAPHIVTKRRWRLPRGLLPATAVLVAAVAFAAYYAAQDSDSAIAAIEDSSDTTAPIDIGPETWVLRAETASWVRVEDSAGVEIFNAIMVPGQVVVLPVDSAPVVEARDGGAIRLRLGGRDLGPLGAKGRSVSGLSLADRLSEAKAG